MTIHAVLVLIIGLLALMHGPATAAQPIRLATVADVPLMVEKAVEQDPHSSTSVEYTQRFTMLLGQSDTIALVSEAEGHVNGVLLAARLPGSPAATQDAPYYIEWSWAAKDHQETIWQALFQELARQAAARGVSQIAIPAERRAW